MTRGISYDKEVSIWQGGSHIIRKFLHGKEVPI